MQKDKDIQKIYTDKKIEVNGVTYTISVSEIMGYSIMGKSSQALIAFQDIWKGAVVGGIQAEASGAIAASAEATTTTTTTIKAASKISKVSIGLMGAAAAVSLADTICRWVKYSPEKIKGSIYQQKKEIRLLQDYV